MGSNPEWGPSQYFELSEVAGIFETPGQVLRVLLLADDQHSANVVQDHIRSFCAHSTHSITVANPRYGADHTEFETPEFNAILIHYSIYPVLDTYLPRGWQEFVSAFRGAVVAIHEDEYQKVDAFKQKLAELGVQALLSCLDSTDTMKRVYGNNSLLRNMLFFSCLPGYIPHHLKEMSGPPTCERPFDLVYRGRTLAPELGRLGQEKRLIGEQMLVSAQTYGLSCDISSDEEDRIYGPQWPLFLASGKAMLGVEGGASIFDFDGEISAKVSQYKLAHPNATFDEIWNSILRVHEGNIDFRTITPKFFEAIAAKTVLVLYPGKYSNVLIPDRHYIVLERDGSNITDVVDKLRDDKYLQEMADRTHAEILHRNELSCAFYVRQVDRVLWALAKQPSVDRLMRNAKSIREAQASLRSEMFAMRKELIATTLRLNKLERNLSKKSAMRALLTSLQQKFR